MGVLDKFIESIQVRVSNAGFREVIRPLYYNGSIEEKNMLIHVNRGKMMVSTENTKVRAGESYFIPQGQKATLMLGKPNKKYQLSVSGFNSIEHRRQYLRDISSKQSWTDKKEIVTIISFESSLYNAFDFFPMLAMPPICIPEDEHFSFLVSRLVFENEQKKLGRSILMNIYMQEMIVHIFRYIQSKPTLTESFEKLSYLTDKKLVTIVSHIQKNLDKDLTNKTLASIVTVSEDYVGQFFKSLTNLNLQAYIENQRLEKAKQLLKTLPDSIMQIAVMVGFHDPAYFSRRFALKYGMNPSEMKRQISSPIV